jgi:hypothetical protein
MFYLAIANIEIFLYNILGIWIRKYNETIAIHLNSIFPQLLIISLNILIIIFRNQQQLIIKINKINYLFFK